MKWLFRLIDLLLVAVLCVGLLVSSSLLPYESSDQPRAYTRSLEFDYVSWELDAILLKDAQGALDVPRYLTIAQQHQVVTQYRSEERRVGKECPWKCRSRWSPYH
jgi:hypothetical protein